MSKPNQHPIQKLAFELMETDPRGAVALSDANADRLASALLAYPDAELLDAVRALAVVGFSVMRALRMRNAGAVGDRILCIAELSMDRVKRWDRRKATEAERLRSTAARRIASSEVLNKAPAFGAARPAGTISAASLIGPRRGLR
jgi:hypothetical protein